MKASNTATSHEEYIALVEEPKRSEIQTLHDLIRRALPDFEPVMMSGFMGYGPYHYKYPSGREGDWFKIGLAANKTGISLYICMGDTNGYFPEQAKDRLGKASVGKSCIRFKKLQDINLATVEELLEKARNAEPMM
jgi:peptidoglycan/xylan/chitin deacetylase (PgdA/CDA1 family)